MHLLQAFVRKRARAPFMLPAGVLLYCKRAPVGLMSPDRVTYQSKRSSDRLSSALVPNLDPHDKLSAHVDLARHRQALNIVFSKAMGATAAAPNLLVHALSALNNPKKAASHDEDEELNLGRVSSPSYEPPGI